MAGPDAMDEFEARRVARKRRRSLLDDDFGRSLREQKERRRLKAEKAQVQEDPGFWKSALNTAKDAGAKALDVAKPVLDVLSGPQEIVAGFAGNASDVLSKTLDGDFKGAGESALKNIKAAGKAIIPFYGPYQQMQTDSDIRKRGKEFNQQVGRTVTAAEEMALETPVLGTSLRALQPALDAPDIIEAIGGPKATDVRDFRNELGFSIITDPLNAVPGGAIGRAVGGGYKLLKATKPAAAFIERFPRLALAPERLVLKIKGANKAAHVLGDDQMQRLYAAQQAFEEEAAPAFQRMYQESLLAEKETFQKLNLNEAQEALVRQNILPVAETPQAWRGVKAAQVSPDQQVQDALKEIAEIYGDKTAEIAALERRFHHNTANFISDKFDYAMRQFSPELRAWQATNPTARQIITGTKRKLDRQAFESAWAGFERSRKLRDVGIEEAEAVIRKDLEAAGLPANIPIFSRDAFGDLARRAEAGMRRAKLRHLWVAGMDVFGKSLDQQQVMDVVRGVFDAQEAAKWKKAAEAGLEAMDAQDVLAGFKSGKQALHEAGKGARAAERQADAGLGRIEQGQQRLAGTATQARGGTGYWRDVRPGEVLEPGRRSRLDVGTGKSQVFEEGTDVAQKAVGKEADRWNRLVGKQQQMVGRAVVALAAADDGARSTAKVVESTQARASDALKRMQDASKKYRQARQMLQEAEATGESLAGATRLRHEQASLAREWDAAVRENKSAQQALKSARADHAKASEVAQKARAKVDAERNRLALGRGEVAKMLGQTIPDAVAAQGEKIAGGVQRGMRDFARAAQNVRKGEAAAETAAQGVEGAREGLAAREIGQTLRSDAAQAAKSAEEATGAAMMHDVQLWSPEAKAKWVQNVVKRQGLAAPPGQISALEVLQTNKVPLPDSLEDLSRLATSFVDPDDATRLRKFAEEFYLPQPTRSTVGRWMDGIKQIYQRALLARVGSLTKDLLGTTSQAFVAGNTVEDVARAVRDLGGNPEAWARGIGKGFKAPDDVLALTAEGVLQTTKEEALVKGAFEGVPGLGRVEERGLLGALVPGKAGEKVGKATDALLNARVWYEQTQRLATYRKGIREGLSHRQAVDNVYIHWGQFNEISNNERLLSKGLMFWSWRLRSLGVAGHNLLNHPVRSRLLLFIAAHGAEGLPDWFNRIGGWVLGTDENGNVDAIGTGGSTYFSPMFSMLQGDGAKAIASGDYAAGLAGLGMDVARSAHPLAVGGGEFLQRKDYFTGEDWEDDEGQSTVKAPMGFWWLMNHNGEPNQVEKFLGLTAKTDRDGKLRSLTIKPELGWLMSVIPGLDPLMTDASAFVDPRFGPGGAPGRGESGGISPGKGIARTLGFPVYRFKLDEPQRKNAMDFRRALHAEVSDLAGDALAVYAGRIVPNKGTLRGDKIHADREQWRMEAERKGLGPLASTAYVNQRMTRVYPVEWRLMDLDRRLQILQDANREQEQANKAMRKLVGVQ